MPRLAGVGQLKGEGEDLLDGIQGDAGEDRRVRQVCPFQSVEGRAGVGQRALPLQQVSGLPKPVWTKSCSPMGIRAPRATRSPSREIAAISANRWALVASGPAGRVGSDNNRSTMASGATTSSARPVTASAYLPQSTDGSFVDRSVPASGSDEHARHQGCDGAAHRSDDGVGQGRPGHRHRRRQEQDRRQRRRGRCQQTTQRTHHRQERSDEADEQGRRYGTESGGRPREMPDDRGHHRAQPGQG